MMVRKRLTKLHRVAILSMAITILPKTTLPLSAETVYDNLDGPKDGGSWGLLVAEDRAAQSFRLGSNSSVDSVALELTRFPGQVEGSAVLDVFSDSNGLPDAPLGSLGSVDPLIIPMTTGPDDVNYETFTFDVPVLDLIPNEIYHLVLRLETIHTLEFVNGNFDDFGSVQWGLSSQPGTPQGAEAIAVLPPEVTDWRTINGFPTGGPPFPVFFGAAVSAVPEPSTLGLALMATTMLAVILRRKSRG